LGNLFTPGLKSEVIYTAHSSMKELCILPARVRSYDSQYKGLVIAVKNR